MLRPRCSIPCAHPVQDTWNGLVAESPYQQGGPAMRQDHGRILEHVVDDPMSKSPDHSAFFKISSKLIARFKGHNVRSQHLLRNVVSFSVNQ